MKKTLWTCLAILALGYAFTILGLMQKTKTYEKRYRAGYKDYVLRIVAGQRETVSPNIDFYELVNGLEKDGAISSQQAARARSAVLTIQVPPPSHAKAW